jgi:hypothetical protein
MAIANIRFIPKDISRPSVVAIIMTSEAMEEAIPTVSGPAIFAVTNQKIYVKLEGRIMLTEPYQIFLLGIVLKYLLFSLP